MERNNDNSRTDTIHDSAAKRSITKGILQPTPPKPYEDSSMSVRSTIGHTMDYFTRVVNENLVAARAGAFAGIFLLTVYGVSQTPLFFRYRTVSEVPASYFGRRRRLYGRVIGVEKNQTNGHEANDIPVLQVRHLSLIGQMLPKSWFDVVMQYSPRQQAILRWNDSEKESSTSKAEEIPRDLLRIRMAGIEPPPLSRLTSQTEDFLEKFVKDRTLVSIQLLARQIEVDVETDEVQKSSKHTKKRDMSNILPDLKEDHHHDPLLDRAAVRASEEDGTYEHERQVAICKITHRPTMWQLFSTDLGEAMVLAGKANVSSAMLKTTETTRAMENIFKSSNKSLETATTASKNSSKRRVRRFVDASEKLRDARSDVAYLERLSNAEFLAAQNSRGMWSVREVRFHKREVVDEVEFQAKANFLQKLWRWVRGG